MNTGAQQKVVFILDERRFALSLAAVERVLPVVEVDLLPKAPEIVLGVINVQGRIIPVVDIRKRFRLPPREIVLTDRLILANTSRHTVALLVDAVVGVFELSAVAMTQAAAILPGLEYVEGVAKLSDGLVFIHNLETFLSLEEGQGLDAALAQNAAT